MVDTVARNAVNEMAEPVAIVVELLEWTAGVRKIKSVEQLCVI